MFDVQPRTEDRDLSNELYKKLPGMLESRAIRPNPVRIVEGGLKGVAQGFQLYRDGAVAGEKLVYRIE